MKALDTARKIFSEMTPERKKEVERAFELMNSSEEFNPEFEPAMRQMAFGGNCVFDPNGKQVYLEGEFSSEDLLRIVAVMHEGDKSK